jgi:hypothetical protein
MRFPMKVLAMLFLLVTLLALLYYALFSGGAALGTSGGI